MIASVVSRLIVMALSHHAFVLQNIKHQTDKTRQGLSVSSVVDRDEGAEK